MRSRQEGITPGEMRVPEGFKYLPVPGRYSLLHLIQANRLDSECQGDLFPAAC